MSLSPPNSHNLAETQSPEQTFFYKAKPAAADQHIGMLIDGSSEGKLSEEDIKDALNNLRTVVVDITGYKVKIWRRACENLSCLSVYDEGWKQKLNINDSWIEKVGKESKGALDAGDFAKTPMLGMQLMYRVARACEADPAGIFDKDKLLDLRSELLKNVTFPVDVE